MSETALICGHRGFKGKYTENTLYSFNKCYDTGATLIETDLWVTKDGVLVISHDNNTKRVFCGPNGEVADFDILDSTYDEIKDLQTIETGERLLTFKDVLDWFVYYIKNHDNSNEHKLMLDIKKLNPAKLVKYLIKDLLKVNDDIGWWLHRVILGVWDLGIIKFLNQDGYFQNVFAAGSKNALGYKQFDIFHISVSWKDSLHYINYNSYVDTLPNDGSVRFKATGVSIIYLLTWSTRFLTTFVPRLKSQRMKLYMWTINTFDQFEYLMNIGKIARISEYGIITDYPQHMMTYRDKHLDFQDSDNEIASEITRLTKSIERYDTVYEPATVHLTVKQRIMYLFYKSFNYIGGAKRVTDEELQFDSFVDEDKRQPIKINKFFLWIFATCQKYGVF
ncbi:unnamed protein product [Debaryomyces tyrocola]|nr:unnamed protein product [Debaryomyces tyrocola]